MTIDGGCLCGALRYRVTGAALAEGYCCCGDCRRASGSGFMPFMVFLATTVTFSGKSRQFASPAANGGEAVRSFCPGCGGLVFGGIPGVDDSHTIYAGSLDDPAAFHPAMVIFECDRPVWVVLPTGLSVFDAMPQG